MHQEPTHNGAGVPGFYRMKSRCQLSRYLFWRSGEESASKLILVVARLQFLEVLGLSSSFLAGFQQGLLSAPGGHLYCLPFGFLHLQASKGTLNLCFKSLTSPSATNWRKWLLKEWCQAHQYNLPFLKSAMIYNLIMGVKFIFTVWGMMPVDLENILPLKSNSFITLCLRIDHLVFPRFLVSPLNMYFKYIFFLFLESVLGI